jgi:hypothetical protein
MATSEIPPLTPATTKPPTSAAGMVRNMRAARRQLDSAACSSRKISAPAATIEAMELPLTRPARPGRHLELQNDTQGEI